MVARLVSVSLCLGLCLALCGSVRAASLSVSAEPPLSGDRLGDALRAYVDAVNVTVAPVPDEESGTLRPTGGMVTVSLRKSHGAGEDATVIVVDGDETVVARLPGVLRTEDLYRAAALKVQALLQRRAPPGGGDFSEALSAERAPTAWLPRDRLLLDVGLAWIIPSAGLGNQGLHLGAGLGLGKRWRIELGGYVEPSQSTHNQDIAVSGWELPFELSLGLALHRGAWQAWLQALGQLAMRRVSAEGASIGPASDTTVSPRAGGALAFAVGLSPGLTLQARASLLASLADTRYRVDGQVVWPAARALLLFEAGFAYGIR
jgi:hypothetical protein